MKTKRRMRWRRTPDSDGADQRERDEAIAEAYRNAHPVIAAEPLPGIARDPELVPSALMLSFLVDL